MSTTFTDILRKYRTKSFSEHDKGTRFERLMQAYLLTDPKYANRFKHVWQWSEFPARKDFGGGQDVGIDLVALTHHGEYWAIQCKCYAETAYINKPEVDTFLSSSSRSFKDEYNGFRTTRFSQRVWISTTNRWNSNATAVLSNQDIPVTRINLYDLEQAPVDWGKLEKGLHGGKARLPQKKLRLHQKEALEKTQKYFRKNDRGKLIMACGTGKTFTSLRIAEAHTQGNGFVLFLVPSIALLGQTLREWTAESRETLRAFCICSDSEVSQKKTYNEDTGLTSVIDLTVPATTRSGFTTSNYFAFDLCDENNLC